ncbi:MAG: hypothetical protein SAJ12_08980 [Jaaginema sp. PMC 1079.18]|nr:hypothetical protein [Jaaginema sp. PMC 1080.18]MEC4851134.1 hypothetical protein [Jaaginema sp. PMC 1079.18]MEC4866374.1 hypothetical protein [Jaaginema sp. PMC 1078.18]
MQNQPEINPKHQKLVTSTSESMDKFHKAVHSFYQEVSSSPAWEWDRFTENFEEVYETFIDLRLKIKQLDDIMKSRR